MRGKLKKMGMSEHMPALSLWHWESEEGTSAFIACCKTCAWEEVRRFERPDEPFPRKGAVRISVGQCITAQVFAAIGPTRVHAPLPAAFMPFSGYEARWTPAQGFQLSIISEHGAWLRVLNFKRLEDACICAEALAEKAENLGPIQHSYKADHWLSVWAKDTILKGEKPDVIEGPNMKW